MDRHSFDTDPNPDPTFHFDADPDPDPTTSFTHVGKSEFFYFYLFTAGPIFIVLAFLSALQVSKCSLFWTAYRFEFFWRK